MKFDSRLLVIALVIAFLMYKLWVVPLYLFVPVSLIMLFVGLLIWNSWRRP